MCGQDIKIQLLKLHLTQRWLLEKLHHRGFATLHEPKFSNVLNGVYTAGDASEIIDAADRVLKEYTKTV